VPSPASPRTNSLALEETKDDDIELRMPVKLQKSFSLDGVMNGFPSLALTNPSIGQPTDAETDVSARPDSPPTTSRRRASTLYPTDSRGEREGGSPMPRRQSLGQLAALGQGGALGGGKKVRGTGPTCAVSTFSAHPKTLYTCVTTQRMAGH
jgi:hypothetical protein